MHIYLWLLLYLYATSATCTKYILTIFIWLAYHNVHNDGNFKSYIAFIIRYLLMVTSQFIHHAYTFILACHIYTSIHKHTSSVKCTQQFCIDKAASIFTISHIKCKLWFLSLCKHRCWELELSSCCSVAIRDFHQCSICYNNNNKLLFYLGEFVLHCSPNRFTMICFICCCSSSSRFSLCQLWNSWNSIQIYGKLNRLNLNVWIMTDIKWNKVLLKAFDLYYLNNSTR